MNASQVGIVGGGPAGLVTAIACRLQGLTVSLFERGVLPIDKACGEGLMPAGVHVLQSLGVWNLIDPQETARFERIEYIQENGQRAIGTLPAPGGTGIRRLALSAALTRRAREVGVIIHEHSSVQTLSVSEAQVTLTTQHGTWQTEVLIAADGLHSRVRSLLGMSTASTESRRYGMRRHKQIAPWSSAVEVYFGPGIEAYVTPAGIGRIGLAFLWEGAALSGKVNIDTLLDRVPALKARVATAAWDSETLGAGPFLQNVSRRTGPRVALVGDAAGYVDAITGEGLTLAFEQATVLSQQLGAAFAGRQTLDRALEQYEVTTARLFRKYAWLAQALVFTARHVWFRKAIITLLGWWPWLFSRVLQVVTGPSTLPKLP